MSDDFYCNEVLAGRTQVTVVAETEHVLAFKHTNPSWPVHIVVIPKCHTESMLSFLENHSDLLPEMMSVISQVARDVTRQYGGCRLTTNFGSYQQTRHLHWHIYVGETMT